MTTPAAELTADPVSSGNISVIIQGPIDREPGLASTVAGVRRLLPECELIVSTWAGSVVPVTATIDKLLLNNDPGPSLLKDGTQISNINRQIVSTVSGIVAASRDYVLKMRVDTPMTSTALCMAAPTVSGEVPSLLQEKISMPNLAFRDPFETEYLFHPSDIVHFGRRADLLDLWDIPLFNPVDWAPPGGYSWIVPEQFLTCSWLRKHRVAMKQIRHRFDALRPNAFLWHRIIESNFRVLDYRKCGFNFPNRISDHQLYDPQHFLRRQLERARTNGGFRRERAIFSIWYTYQTIRHAPRKIRRALKTRRRALKSRLRASLLAWQNRGK